MKKTIIALVAVACATPAFAGIYNDTTANNSFAAAANLNPYFSNGYSADIGNSSGTNTSLSAPWVTVYGQGNGSMYDFYSFTTTQTGTVILDIDYTQSYANGFDSYLNIYNANQVQISSNDDGGTVAGAGGSIHGFDSFIQVNNLAAGNYFVRVGRCCVDTIPSATSRYTLQVQALADVAPVPEPETYAMLLAGLGLVGGVARRKQAGKRAA